MENFDIQNLWNNHSTDLQKKLEVDFTAFKSTNIKKKQLQLNKLLYRRLAESIVFLLFTVLLIIFCIRNYAVPQYLISGIVLGVFSIIGSIGSVWQILLILKLDYSAPTTMFLMKLEKLKVYSLQVLRLIFLSFPFYFAYIVIGFKVVFNFDIYGNANSNWVLLNLIVSILFIPFSIWIYKRLSLNTKSNWVKKLISDNGGKQIDSSILFINEIITYKKKEINRDL